VGDEVFEAYNKKDKKKEIEAMLKDIKKDEDELVDLDLEPLKK
jgi:hypothetical protein